MPDVEAGATPVTFGNLRQTYVLASRRNVSMQHGAYSVGLCYLLKFAAPEICGGIFCPNAARLLRIRYRTHEQIKKPELAYYIVEV